MKKHVIVSRREGDYDFYSLRKDPLMAWVPADHPRVRDGVYPLRDFETEPYIDTYPGQETDNNLAFRAHDLTPRGQFLSIDVESTKAMVAAGLGVSLNNAILAHEMDLSGVAVLPTEPSYEVEIGIAAQRKENRSPAAEQFLRFALKNAPAMPADSTGFIIFRVEIDLFITQLESTQENNRRDGTLLTMRLAVHHDA